MICCCAQCSVASDDFNRSNGTDIDTGSSCGWTEQSGAWEIASNALKITGTTTGIATCDTAAPDALVNISLTLTKPAGVVRQGVVFNYTDANNYWEAGVSWETSFGSPNYKVYIGRKVGGTYADLDSEGIASLTGTTFALNVCHDGERVTATLHQSTTLKGICTYEVSGLTSGTVGVTRGTSGSSIDVIFDDFTLRKASEECGGCAIANGILACTNCCTGTDKATAIYDLDMTGISDSECGCESLNTLSLVRESVFSCQWRYEKTLCEIEHTCTDPNVGCGGTNTHSDAITALFVLDRVFSGGVCFWRLTVSIFGGTHSACGPISTVCCDPAFAQQGAVYESSTASGSATCQGTFTLSKVSSSETFAHDCGGGTTQWKACDITWPSSLTIESVA